MPAFLDTSPPPLTTLGSLVREFQRIYALPPAKSSEFELGHDGVHVMTGMGITLADELRVDVYLSCLSSSYDLVSDPEYKSALIAAAEEDMTGLYTRLKSHHEDPHNNLLAAMPTTLGTDDFARIQLDSEILTRDELVAHVELGIEINTVIHDLTGHSYTELSEQELAQLNIDTVDFSHTVNDIKQALQSKTNARVEEETARLFFATAAAQGRGHDVPAASTPWRGIARRPFKMGF